MPLSIKRKFNLRKSPKNLEKFKAMYAGKMAAGTIRLADERTKVISAVSFVKSLVGKEALKRGGEGTQLVFPMRSALGHGEFVKGILKVIAPRTRVVFLVTPQHTYLSSVPFKDANNRAIKKRALENLSGHVRKSIRPGMKTVIVDDADSGGTFRAVTKSMRSMGLIGAGKGVELESTLPLGDFVLDYYHTDTGEYRRRLTLGWEKDFEGKSAMDQGNWERYQRKLGVYKGAPIPTRPLTRDSNQRRRMLFNLGVAVANEYLAMRKK
ncbi:MAG: hypothetical protein AABW59_03645 [archaeon]